MYRERFKGRLTAEQTAFLQLAKIEAEIHRTRWTASRARDRTLEEHLTDAHNAITLAINRLHMLI